MERAVKEKYEFDYSGNRGDAVTIRLKDGRRKHFMVTVLAAGTHEECNTQLEIHKGKIVASMLDQSGNPYPAGRYGLVVAYVANKRK